MKDILISILVASFLLAGCSGMNAILSNPLASTLSKGMVYEAWVKNPERAIRALEVLAKGEGKLESTILLQKSQVIDWIVAETTGSGNPFFDFVVADIINSRLEGWEDSIQLVGPEGRARLALIITDYRDVANLALAAQ